MKNLSLFSPCYTYICTILYAPEILATLGSM